MSDWTCEAPDSSRDGRPSLSRRIFVRTVPAIVAFSFSAVVALRLAGGLAEEAFAPSPAAGPASTETPAETRKWPFAARGDAARNAAALKQQVSPFGALFDPDGALVGVPTLYAGNAPVGPAFSPLQSEPLFVLADPEPQAPAEQMAEQAADAAPQLAQSQPEPPVAAKAPALLASVEPPRPVPAPPELRLQVVEAVPALAPVARPEVFTPVPPARPEGLTIQARAVEAAPPRVENATPRVENATPRVENATSRVENAAPRREAARVSPRDKAQATTLSQNDPRNFFEQIFNGGDDRQKAGKGPQLAYASPDGGALNVLRGVLSSPSPVTVAPGTAVYDISAHTVYLPNGETLEAHSGLGPYFDNPDHVHRRMQGATPPAVYNLTLRESLFHGVQALRLTPVAGNVHGRNGLLAHTFMLGPRGDSNGCVSFRNYRPFLQAYMNGEIRRLVVVARR